VVRQVDLLFPGGEEDGDAGLPGKTRIALPIARIAREVFRGSELVGIDVDREAVL
jgi:hypothetical protein